MSWVRIPGRWEMKVKELFKSLFKWPTPHGTFMESKIKEGSPLALIHGSDKGVPPFIKPTKVGNLVRLSNAYDPITPALPQSRPVPTHVHIRFNAAVKPHLTPRPESISTFVEYKCPYLYQTFMVEIIPFKYCQLHSLNRQIMYSSSISILQM